MNMSHNSQLSLGGDVVKRSFLRPSCFKTKYKNWNHTTKLILGAVRRPNVYASSSDTVSQTEKFLSKLGQADAVAGRDPTGEMEFESIDKEVSLLEKLIERNVDFMSDW